MTISRMQMERQLRAGGGIMTLDEPRQGYFLGKIVKKAKRAVKKVVKTDPKLKKTPPTFSKVINQLLPAIFILLIFIYFVHFFKKRS